MNVNCAQLSRIVERDPALSAKLVALAAHTEPDHSLRPASIEALISPLGTDVIRAVAATSATEQVFSPYDQRHAAGLRHFWRDSLTCATLARSLARLIEYPAPGEAYLAGLLYNIGQLVMNRSHPTSYELSIGDAPADLQRREQEQFGITHSELGAELIGAWQLNSFMADAVRYQGRPLEQVLDAHPLVKLIYLASRLSEGEDEDAGFEAADRLLGLNPGVVSVLLTQSREQMEQLASGLRLEEAAPTAPRPDMDDAGNAEARLAARVREFSLLDSVRSQLASASGRDALVHTIRQSASLLFDTCRVLVMLHDREHQVLCAAGFTDEDPLGQFSIHIEPGRSLATEALLRGQVLSSLRQDALAVLPVVDQQVLGLMQSEGMMCLPMIASDVPVGTIVLGVDPVQAAHIEARQSLIELFAAEAGAALHNSEAVRQTVESVEARERGAFETRARQLVHEVNNPLSIMRNYLQVLAMKLGYEHPAQQDLQVIEEELARVGALVRRLTEDPVQEQAETEPVFVNELISDLLRVSQGSMLTAHHIETRLDLDETMAPIVTSRSKLKQVLINLIKNAAEAMPESGTLSIATRDGLIMDSGRYAEITISDTGPGIAPEILDHVFEPVRSTKGEDHAGLGLSIVKNLVKDLGGTVSFTSDQRRGTCFRLHLPVADEDDRTQQGQN